MVNLSIKYSDMVHYC